MKAYPEYSDTTESWIGEVPCHWEKIKFKYVLKEKLTTHNIDLQCGSISFGNVVYKDSEKLTEETKLAYQEVLSGEFLVNPLNLNYDLKSLRTALSNINVIVSSGYIVLQSENIANSNYLRWLLFDFDVRHMKTLGAGIRQTITSKDIGNCKIYLPSEKEQIAIANYLDRETGRIDNLIVEKQKFINLINEKRQVMISHVVTKGLEPNVKIKDSGIDWLGQVPEHWVLKKIKYNVKSIGQGWSPQCESTPVLDGGAWAVVKVGCVNKGIFEPLKNKKLPDDIEPREECVIKQGDLLVSRANAKEWVGSAAVPQKDYPKLLLCDKIYRIKLDKKKVSPDFISYYLGSDKAREQIEIDATGTSSSMLNIGQSTILDLVIAQPDLDEQLQIVEQIRSKTKKLDDLIKEAQSSIELLKEHRIALISAAITGKIDVRNKV